MVVTVGTVCLLGVQGSDYRNKVPAAEDVAQVTVQPMVQDPLVDLPDYMLEPGTHSVSTDTTEPQELESSYTFTDPASVALCSCIGIALPQQRLRRWAAAALSPVFDIN